MGYSVHRFVDALPDEVLCQECHKVVRDPVECKNCWNLSCKKCLPGYMIFFKSAPKEFSCRSCKRLSTFKETSKTRRKRIENLTIHCKNEGCRDVVRLCMLKSHQKTCPYQVICCRGKNCTAQQLKMNSFRLEIYPEWYQGVKQEMWTCSLRCKKVLEFECSLYFNSKYTSISRYYSLLEKIHYLNKY